MQEPSAKSFDYNYKELGFCAGLEIHAQLQSERKLFCHCLPELVPATAHSDYHFERYFRPVLGELGDFDAGMLVEFEKQYRVIYETYGDNICTYEMDETPPFPPCNETITKGFLLARFLNCESPVNEVIFNRKQYLDGSITTGFQRTTIIARDGFINHRNKKIRINNVLIEEDAARRVNFHDRASRTVYYNLDRLGIPLTEIITNHLDCHDPFTLQNIGLVLGLGLRVLGIARRGIGTVRQDVNISITGGARVELKGIQDIDNIPQYCDHEITRQLALLELMENLKKRGIKKSDFQANYIDVSSAITNLGDSEIALAVRLSKCKDIFLKEVQPGKQFAEELFDRIELITGISMGNMSQSDSPQNWLDSHRVREILNLQTDDSFVVIRGTQKSVIHALSRTIERMNKALVGVPEETRRINPKTFNSEFLRVIHGKDRMYSDTDTPPLSISLDYPNLVPNDIIPPWELGEKYPISVRELIFIEKVNFYPEFSYVIQKFPESCRKLLGLIERASHYMEKQNLRKDKNSLSYRKLLVDLITKRVSKDFLEEILLEINSSGDYNREKRLQELTNIDDDMYRRIKVVIADSEKQSDEITIGKLFGILKTHFTMLTSEQIHSTLLKEGKIGEN
ncbi:MAG: Glu-tRNA(Gln) amidotransferase subunit GatE [Candidatus Hodarchaeales archaeon]